LDEFFDYMVNEDRQRFRQRLGSLESRIKKEEEDGRTKRKAFRAINLLKRL